jgi:hypothetical protein
VQLVGCCFLGVWFLEAASEKKERTFLAHDLGANTLRTQGFLNTTPF